MWIKLCIVDNVVPLRHSSFLPPQIFQRESGQYLHYNHEIRGTWDVHFKNYAADLSGESKQASSCRKAAQSSPCTSNHCIIGFIIRGLYLDGQTLKHSHPLVLEKIRQTDGSYREMS